MNIEVTLQKKLGLVALPWGKVCLFLALALFGVLASVLLRPSDVAAVPLMPLNESVPRSFGAWREIKSPLVPMTLTPDGDRSAAVAATYDESFMGTFDNGSGNQVMVALAYGRSQRQEGKIHRPELCYSSQGFSVGSTISKLLSVSDGGPRQIAANRLVAEHRGRKEIVSYWIRIGDLFSTNAVATRLYILKEGLEGRIPDGILVRVSQIVDSDATQAEMENAFRRQEQMVADMVGGVPEGRRRLFLGTALRSSSNAS